MDLGRDLALAVVAQEVLLQQHGQLQGLLVLLPAGAGDLHEARLEILKGLRLSLEFLPQPFHG